MKIEVFCNFCGKSIQRERAEVNRAEKKNYKHYCSHVCSGKNVSRKHPKLIHRNMEEYLKTRIDDFSKFRRHYNNLINRKYKDYSVTLQDLKEQWDKQKGICPYTGLALEIPKSTVPLRYRNPYRASVDRIDNSKGYHKDNIEFVSIIAQYAKHMFTKEQLLEFCCHVAKNHQNEPNSVSINIDNNKIQNKENNN